jgi:hypothetical protein
MLKPSSRVVLAAIACVCAANMATAADLVYHHGFETCWVAAQTKPQFLATIRTSVDGTSSCIPPQSGSEPPITYTACNNANGCGVGIPGCPVALQAGAFSGDFVTGHFSAPGTASNINVPISTNLLGSCTLNLTGITLSYTLDYLMQTDGTDGVHSSDLLTPVVDIVSYTATNNCNSLIAALIDSYVPQAIDGAETNAAAAIEPGLRANTLERSICPLSAP